MAGAFLPKMRRQFAVTTRASIAAHDWFVMVLRCYGVDDHIWEVEQKQSEKYWNLEQNGGSIFEVEIEAGIFNKNLTLIRLQI